jgi:hypothetical protein
MKAALKCKSLGCVKNGGATAMADFSLFMPRQSLTTESRAVGGLQLSSLRKPGSRHGSSYVATAAPGRYGGVFFLLLARLVCENSPAPGCDAEGGEGGKIDLMKMGFMRMRTKWNRKGAMGKWMITP